MIYTGILQGLVLSSNSICLNTQLAVKVCISWCANFNVAYLWVVMWGFMTKFYFDVCPTFFESLFETDDLWCIYNAWEKTIPDFDNTDWEETLTDVEVCMLHKQRQAMSSCCWKVVTLLSKILLRTMKVTTISPLMLRYTVERIGVAGHPW